MSSQTKNLYESLEIDKSASSDDIKKAYMKMAKVHHPDKGGDQEKFKEIQKAYEILKDDHKRRVYDEAGIIPEENGGGMGGGTGGGGFPGFPGNMGGGFPFNVNNMFNSFFRNMGAENGNNFKKGRKGPVNVQNVPLSLEQYYTGTELKININRQKYCGQCGHSGIKKKEGCNTCRGTGNVVEVVNMGNVMFQSSNPCKNCSGKGFNVIDKCDPCSGTGYLNETNVLSISVKPGTQSGNVYVFPEACSDNDNFDRPGDAHIIIIEDITDVSYKVWKRCGDKGKDLETNITISLSECLIGCKVVIENHPKYENGIECIIPPGSFEGDKYKLSNYGMPVYSNDSGKNIDYGDAYIIVHVNINDNERELYKNKAHLLLTPIFDKYTRKCEEECDKSVNVELVKN